MAIESKLTLILTILQILSKVIDFSIKLIGDKIEHQS